jgi:hypothetical protein
MSLRMQDVLSKPKTGKMSCRQWTYPPVNCGLLKMFMRFFFHAEETLDQFLINEYRPSREVMDWLKELRTASLYAQANIV